MTFHPDHKLLDSLTLGRFEHDGADYQYDGRESLITIARPGRGKSQAHVIRNLLRLEAPAIVLDVKPEIYEATYRWRRRAVGPIERFQPSDRKGSACFNPLDTVSRDPVQAFEDIARLVPLLMVPRDKTGAKSFWESRAAQMLTAALYDVCLHPQDQPSRLRDMSSVVDWFSPSAKQLASMVKRLKESGVRPLIRTGNQLETADPETQSNIFETALSHIQIWGSPQLERLIGSTTINLDSFREANGTLYLCVTESELVAYRPVIRTILGTVLHRLREDRESWPLPPVTFFLDEFPQLGYMEEIEQMLALGRQPGLRLWFFAQTMGQLTQAYGDADRLLDMLAVRCFIAPSGTLAEKLSKELGSVRDVFSGKERPLATPQELAGPEYASKVLVLEGGRAPARLDLVMAYADPAVAARMPGGAESGEQDFVLPEAIVCEFATSFRMPDDFARSDQAVIDAGAYVGRASVHQHGVPVRFNFRIFTSDGALKGSFSLTVDHLTELANAGALVRITPYSQDVS